MSKRKGFKIKTGLLTKAILAGMSIQKKQVKIGGKDFEADFAQSSISQTLVVLTNKKTGKTYLANKSNLKVMVAASTGEIAGLSGNFMEGNLDKTLGSVET